MALPLPTDIGDTSVRINSIAAPLYYVDSTQINAQVPWEVSGATRLDVQVVRNGVPSNLATVTLSVQAPGIFLVTHAADGTVVTSANPALPGEYLTIYCTGLGLVTTPPATGAAAAASPPSSTLVNPAMWIGGGAANVVFSGLTPGFAGLYQVNAQVPSGAPSGNDITVVLSIGGVNSNTIKTSVQPNVPSEIQVSVSPSSVFILTGGNQQFTASVSGTSNTSVNWSVNGVVGGNASVGTISANGLYTAPTRAPSPPSPNMVFVAATSPEAPDSMGTATVTLAALPVAPSPLGRVRSAGPGLYVNDIEYRGGTGGFASGYLIRHFNDFDPVLGHTLAAEASLQLDRMREMGVNAITFELETVDWSNTTGPFRVPPACLWPPVLGLQWPQPTPIELANLKAFFDLVQSKGMRIRLRLPNVHMEEQPPTNAQTWLGAILREIGRHPALDLVLFEGSTHLSLDVTPNELPNRCGLPAEPQLWLGPASVPAQYVKWAISYAMSLGIPARKLAAEAVVGSYFYELQWPAGPYATNGHYWSPIAVLKRIFDDLGFPDNQRTYAISMYEHRKCGDVSQVVPCTDTDPHTWAEQTLQKVFATVGTGNGARVVAPEIGNSAPVNPGWRTEWALESLVFLMEKYGIEGGSFWIWVTTPGGEADPTEADAVKRRGVNFIYNPVQKEVLDWGGYHLLAIPNPSFEGDIDSEGTPTRWSVTGAGTGLAYFLAQEAGQPQVPSRGSYSLRLTTGSSTSASVSAWSNPIPVTPGTTYTTAANLRFSWTGDPNPSGNQATRPQVFARIRYLNASGQPTATLPAVFSYFQENSTQGFQTFVFQYTSPLDARSVQIEIGGARNGLGAPIILDVDNLR